MRLHSLILVCVGLLATSSSCFVVTDLNRFKKPDELAPSNFSDLKVTVRGMVSHVNEEFEYRVVDNSNVIQSRGFIIPLGGPAASFSVHGGVPKQNEPFHLDFYADHDNSKGYSERPDVQLDHSWRLPLEDKLLDDNGAYVIIFDHNTSFTKLDAPVIATEVGKPLTVHMRDLGPFQGKRIEVRAADASNKRNVALHRVPVLIAPMTEYEIAVPGMIEPGVSYTIEVYTDDGNGNAGGPGSVKAYRYEVIAAESGIDTTFNAANPTATPNTVAGVAQVSDALPP